MQDAWTFTRRNAVPLLKKTWQNYNRHNGQWLAAALAYFSAFSIAPLIIVAVEIAGLLIRNHTRALNLVFGYLQKDAGSGANAVRQIVAATFNEARHTVVAEIVGWALFVVAAIGLFNAVQFALNTVWDLTPVKMSIWKAIKQRLSAFIVMMMIAGLLLVSIGVNTLMTMASAWLGQFGAWVPTAVKVADFFLSFAIVWAAVALLFAYLPECRIEWRDVGIGAGITAFLFVVGQFLLGWYLGRAGVSSAFGAFGSLVVFLLWCDYSAQIVLIGAEFTHVFAQRRGSIQSDRRAETGEITPTRPPSQALRTP
jgi:membrane protein